jgi:hypothetical protein
MHARPVREICEDYGLTSAEWDAIRVQDGFIVEVSAALEVLKKEGMPFKLRCQTQATELLKKSWEMIQAPYDQVAAPVKADLIKFTIRAAGFDGSKDQAANTQSNQTNFQINIDLSR